MYKFYSILEKGATCKPDARWRERERERKTKRDFLHAANANSLWMVASK